MPKILEIKEIDGDIWCRVGTPGDFESGITLWTPDEQREKFHEGLKWAAEIAGPLKNLIETNQWSSGYQTGRKEARAAILGYIDGDRSTND